MEVVDQQRGRGVPPAQAAARVGLRGAVARALGAGRAARPAAGAAADRVLRHLEPGADRHGRLDGGVRGRAAEAQRLPAVRDQGGAGTGRFRQHGGDAPAAVRAAASGSGTSRSASAGGGSRTRRRSSWSTAARGSSASAARCSRDVGPGHPAHRPGEAAGGGLLPRTARAAADPARRPRRCSSCSTSATRRTGSPSRTTGRSGRSGRWSRRSTRCPASVPPGRRRC